MQEQEMLISIIIPVYNAEKYLAKCLDSILHQTYSKIELLLIDDGSNDASGDICEAYAKQDKRIRVFHQLNRGVSAARNIGIANAMGEWLYFVDADDEVKRNGLNVLVSHIQDDVDMVWGGYEVYDNDTNLIYQIEKDVDCKLSNNEALYNLYVPSWVRYQGNLWCKLIRACVVKNNDVHFHEKIYFNEDRLFITNVLCVSRKPIRLTTESVYKYYERSTGAMSSISKGFNPKFVTDLVAYIMMRRLIKKNIPDRNLHWMASKGVYHACKRLLSIIKRSIK